MGPEDRRRPYRLTAAGSQALATPPGRDGSAGAGRARAAERRGRLSRCAPPGPRSTWCCWPIPRRWRDRYEAEIRALLAERQPGWGDLLDLARGGLDARLHGLVAPPAQLVAAMPRREVVMAVPARPSYGVVEKQPIGELSRRRFLRRMLGAGAGPAAARVHRRLDRLPVANVSVRARREVLARHAGGDRRPAAVVRQRLAVRLRAGPHLPDRFAAAKELALGA